MNVWEVLGIAQTEDIQKIREVYMERAKEVHPEEHPDEFQRLQSAYKTAIKLAKGRKTVENFMLVDTDSKKMVFDQVKNEAQRTKREIQNDVENLAYDFSQVDLLETGKKNEYLQDEFFWKFKQIYCCAYTKNNVKAWEVLMGSSRFDELFGNSDFLADLSTVICGMEAVEQEVWEYFVHVVETSRVAGKCGTIIANLKDKMPEHTISNGDVTMTKEDKQLVKRVVARGRAAGLSRKQAEEMMFFVPNLFVEMEPDKVLTRGEMGKNKLNREKKETEYTDDNEDLKKFLWAVFIIVYIILKAYVRFSFRN